MINHKNLKGVVVIIKKEHLITELNTVILINNKIEKEIYKSDNIYGVIYLLTNKITNKQYIGQHKVTKPLIYRMKIHQWYGKNIEKFNKTKIRKIFNEYNALKYWNIKIIDLAYSKEELSQLEKYNIKQYQTLENGYNSCEGGTGGCKGYKHAIEDKQKISLNNHIRGCKKETKIKIGLANKGKFNSGKCTKIDMYYKNIFMRTFESIQECLRFLNENKINESSIRQILKGKKHCFHSFTFKKNTGIKQQTIPNEKILKYKDTLKPRNWKSIKMINKITGETKIFKNGEEVKKYFNLKCAPFKAIRENLENYKGYKWEIM